MTLFDQPEPPATPEPTPPRTLAGILKVYDGSSGDATSALYQELEQFGPAGTVAVNIFRACKASERAKGYGRKYKGAAYDKKDWSISNLVEALVNHAEALNIRWGWREDPKQEFHKWVLYVDLPTGQVSFHLATRYRGPDYTDEWDGAPTRICRWIAGLYENEAAPK